jgi:hypothetical protein
VLDACHTDTSQGDDHQGLIGGGGKGGCWWVEIFLWTESDGGGSRGRGQGQGHWLSGAWLLLACLVRVLPGHDVASVLSAATRARDNPAEFCAAVGSRRTLAGR